VYSVSKCILCDFSFPVGIAHTDLLLTCLKNYIYITCIIFPCISLNVELIGKCFEYGYSF
jgi:hypothetical protein